MGDATSAPIDLTRATPPVSSIVNQHLQSAMQAIAQRHDLHFLLRSNRIGGNEGDCDLAGRWLTERLGYRPPVERLVVGNGTQNLLAMALRHTAVTNVLLAEELTHPLVPPIATELGVTVVPVAIDADGIIPEAFEAACRQFPHAPLYCNPTGHNPTASVMPFDRRQRIVEIARCYGRYIIEDDVLGSLRPVDPRPVASAGPDRVWYLQTLSKCIGLGMRVAYLVLPDDLSRHDIVGPVAMRSSWFASALSLEIANYLFETGRFAAVAAAMAAVAERRRQQAVTGLQAWKLGSCAGALHVWLGLPLGCGSQLFADRCRKAGVLVRPGPLFRARDGKTLPDICAARIALTAPVKDEDFQLGIERVAAVLNTLMSEVPHCSQE
ncbi:PLP-dependent aminotransferase family protein [Rhizobium mongolense]|uniref:aminotransferase-like domain-containing protein n=1 Tax=Rhizobium mongolense TaxID=57676 RepID=UPI0035567204